MEYTKTCPWPWHIRTFVSPWHYGTLQKNNICWSKHQPTHPFNTWRPTLLVDCRTRAPTAARLANVMSCTNATSWRDQWEQNHLQDAKNIGGRTWMTWISNRTSRVWWNVIHQTKKSKSTSCEVFSSNWPSLLPLYTACTRRSSVKVGKTNWQWPGRGPNKHKKPALLPIFTGRQLHLNVLAPALRDDAGKALDAHFLRNRCNHWTNINDIGTNVNSMQECLVKTHR